MTKINGIGSGRSCYSSHNGNDGHAVPLIQLPRDLNIAGTKIDFILSHPAVKRNGWTAERVSQYFQLNRAVASRAEEKTGRPLGIDYFAAIRDESNPGSTITVDPFNKYFTFLFASGKDSDYSLAHAKRLFCEHLYPVFMYSSEQAFGAFRTFNVFLRGIDNQYLDGLKFTPEDKLLTLLSELAASSLAVSRCDARHPANELLNAVVYFCPLVIRAKMRSVLAPETISLPEAQGVVDTLTDILMRSISSASEDDEISPDLYMVNLAAVCPILGPAGSAEIAKYIRQIIRTRVAREIAFKDLMTSCQGVFFPADRVDVLISRLALKMLMLYDACTESYQKFFDGISLKKQEA